MAETPETRLVETAEQQAQCNRCGRFTELSAGRQRSAQWWCHTCFALEKSVARNMGGFPEEFTPDDKAEFFQRAAQASSGGVKWTVVRALLTEQLYRSPRGGERQLSPSDFQTAGSLGEGGLLRGQGKAVPNRAAPSSGNHVWGGSEDHDAHGAREGRE